MCNNFYYFFTAYGKDITTVICIYVGSHVGSACTRCVVLRCQESLRKQEADAHGRSVLVQILESMYRFGLGSVAGGMHHHLSHMYYCIV